MDHDGTVIQLGYHSNAVPGNEFSGARISLTGEGSANTEFNNTTIGDGGLGFGDGDFGGGFIFVIGSPTSGHNLPRAGTPLALRFFDGKTVAGSRFFEELSSPNWLWKEPSTDPFDTPIVDIFPPGDPNVRRRSGAPIPIDGRIPTGISTSNLPDVPEPSASLVCATGALVLAARRARPKY